MELNKFGMMITRQINLVNRFNKEGCTMNSIVFDFIDDVIDHVISDV